MAPVVMLPRSMPSCSRRSPRTGKRPFRQSLRTRFSVSSPERVVRSMQVMALSNQAAKIELFDRSATGQGLAPSFNCRSVGLHRCGPVEVELDSLVPGYFLHEVIHDFSKILGEMEFSNDFDFWQGSSFHCFSCLALCPASFQDTIKRVYHLV